MTKNRDILESKGIPLENLVISEIPVKKAVSIGNLETSDSGEKNK